MRPCTLTSGYGDPRASCACFRDAQDAVSKLKELVGVKLGSRGLDRQQVEALVKSQVLNLLSALGMPRSERTPEG